MSANAPPSTSSGSPRRSRLKALAWALSVPCFLAAVGAFLLHRAHAFLPGEAPWATENLAALTAFLSFAVVGSVIAGNRPYNALGWTYLSIGWFQVLNVLAVEYARFALLRPDPLPFGGIGIYVAEVAWLLGLIGLILIILLFPNGKPLGRRWWWVAWLAGLSAILNMVGVADLTQTPPEDLVGGIYPPEPWYMVAIVPLLSLALTGATLSLIVRFVRSRGMERQQLKWLTYGVTVMVTLLVGYEFILSPLGVRHPVIEFLALAGMILIPLSTGVAIMRYRLYEIDRIINRTVVYLTSTGALLLVYLAIVVSLQRAFDPVRGDSDLAVVVSTLAAAAMFAPLRRRVQSFVDRHFYRKRYDAQKTLQDFGTRLRDEVDLEQVETELENVVRTTIQPSHASLWIVKGAM